MSRNLLFVCLAGFLFCGCASKQVVRGMYSLPGGGLVPYVVPANENWYYVSADKLPEGVNAILLHRFKSAAITVVMRADVPFNISVADIVAEFQKQGAVIKDARDFGERGVNFRYDLKFLGEKLAGKVVVKPMLVDSPLLSLWPVQTLRVVGAWYASDDAEMLADFDETVKTAGAVLFAGI